jgi:hypothetical protein
VCVSCVAPEHVGQPQCSPALPQPHHIPQPSTSAAWYDAQGSSSPGCRAVCGARGAQAATPPALAAAAPPSDPSRSFGHRQAGPLLPSAASAPPASRHHALHAHPRRPTHMKLVETQIQHWCVSAGGGCAAMWWLVHVSRAGGQGRHQRLVHLSLTPTGTAQKGLWTVAGRPHNHTAAVRRGAEHPTRQHTSPSIYTSLSLLVSLAYEDVGSAPCTPALPERRTSWQPARLCDGMSVVRRSSCGAAQARQASTSAGCSLTPAPGGHEAV